MTDLHQWSLPMIILWLRLVVTAVPLEPDLMENEIMERTSPYDNYSGIRVRPDARRRVFYHEQTVAVVEVGPAGELYNCELMDVYKPEELKTAVHNLSSISKPVKLTFEDMIDLVSVCSKDTFAVPEEDGLIKTVWTIPLTAARGVVPGTKWCGTGDVANNFFELGDLADLDKCCRAHDFCPVKIQGYETRYNVTNESMFTRSHCTCDLMFQQCLRAVNNVPAYIVDKLFFALFQTMCVRQGKERTVFFPNEKHIQKAFTTSKPIFTWRPQYDNGSGARTSEIFVILGASTLVYFQNVFQFI